MPVLLKAILLFGLNFIDAILTLFWIRNDYAEEGNFLMAQVLSFGELPFLAVKVAIGALAVWVFYRFAHLRVAQIGVSLALAVYVLLMGVHLVTGFAAVAR